MENGHVTVTGKLVQWIESNQPREVWATSNAAAKRIARGIEKRLGV